MKPTAYEFRNESKNDIYVHYWAYPYRDEKDGYTKTPLYKESHPFTDEELGKMFNENAEFQTSTSKYMAVETFLRLARQIQQGQTEITMPSEAVVRYGKEYSEMSDEELKENHIVKINDSDLIWNIIPSISPRKDKDEELIRLSWGMGTDYFVDTNKNFAQLLIMGLTEIINKPDQTEIPEEKLREEIFNYLKWDKGKLSGQFKVNR